MNIIKRKTDPPASEGRRQFTWKRIRQYLALVLCSAILITIFSAHHGYKANAGNPALLPSATIHLGSSGSDVTNVQTRLGELGFFTDTPDGNFGLSTQAAVMDFQRITGLSIDGIVDTQTAKHIYADDAPYKYDVAERNVIQLGDSGDNVTALQERLSELGYFTALVDGDFSTQTHAAVEDFQKASSLTVTGQADDLTQENLYSISAIAKNTSTVLKSGSIGEHVTRLQQQLQKLNYFRGTPTGTFDSNTEKAVAAFHRDIGMIADGIAGPITQGRLYSSDQSFSNYTTLTPTSTGAAVIRLQLRLRDLRYYTGDCIGVYSTLTEAAVISFQRELGLKETGVANGDLQQKLYSLSAPAAMDVLIKGDYGDEVRKLQSTLIDLGYLGSSVTGTFAALTEVAVMDFQTAKGINPVDGRATPAVLAALSQESNLQKPTLTRDLKKGCEGEDVRTIQRRLADLGYYTNVIDGSFGTESDYAVRDFQLNASIEINGKVDSSTLNKMYASNAPSKPYSTGKTLRAATLRKSIGSSGTVLKTLPKDVKVYIVSSNKGWYYVKLHNSGVEGYIASSDLSISVRAVLMNNSSITVSSTFSLSVRVNDSIASNKNVTWSSSDSSIASVSTAGVVTAIKSGKVVIRATARDGSGAYAECSVTSTAVNTPVQDPSDDSSTEVSTETGSSTGSTTNSPFSVTFSKYSVTIPKGKTVYLKTTFSTSSARSLVSWHSDNTNVATFKEGHITAVGTGTTIVRVKDNRNSTLKATIVVNVTAAEPVISGYVTPNIAKPGATVTLVAITDSTRDKIRFEVTDANGSKNTYETSSYTTSGNRRIWKNTATISGTGISSVTAYSSKNGTLSSSGFSFKGYTTPLAGSTTPVTGERLVSDELIQFLAECEGWSATIYGDMVGNPTIGYGYAIFDGFSYYDNLTREEGWALLVSMTNNSYTSPLNNFIVNNGLKMTQAQFDSLVSLGYNIGAGFVNSPSSYSLVRNIKNAPNKDASQVAKSDIIYGFSCIHHIRVSGGLQDVAGLLYRRFEEIEMYLEGDYQRNFSDWQSSGKKYTKYPYPEGFQNGKVHS